MLVVVCVCVIGLGEPSCVCVIGLGKPSCVCVIGLGKLPCSKGFILHPVEKFFSMAISMQLMYSSPG